ncbi:MAG TPA: nucleoside hydrolase [Acidimicrobiales bacterium]|nr:nucleoside hydrolase [Acidimicrobiales bacterium]
MRVHLDTDIGTTMDDLAALVMLLGWPGVEMTGITTCIDPGGRRAGYVHYILRSAGGDDIPVAAGAEVSMTSSLMPGGIPDDQGRWPEPVAPAPSPAGAASRLLADSIEAGATIVAIGPFTNLALLAVERPDVIARAHVVMMGGWFDPPPEGLPSWGPARDWNVQCDTTAARMVTGRAGMVTMVPLSLTIRAFLRHRQLARLRAAGPLGRLLAAQAEHEAAERSTGELARSSAGLPDDLLAFHHDPLTCAVALGWPGVTFDDRRLAPVLDGGLLQFADSHDGRLVRIGVDMDAAAFEEMWLSSVEGAELRSQRR